MDKNDNIKVTFKFRNLASMGRTIRQVVSFKSGTTEEEINEEFKKWILEQADEHCTWNYHKEDELYKLK